MLAYLSETDVLGFITWRLLLFMSYIFSQHYYTLFRETVFSKNTDIFDEF